MMRIVADQERLCNRMPKLILDSRVRRGYLSTPPYPYPNLYQWRPGMPLSHALAARIDYGLQNPDWNETEPFPNIRGIHDTD